MLTQTSQNQMTKTRIANLTSNILNPFWLSLTIIVLLSFASAPSTADAIKWALITMAFSIVPVFLAIIYLLHTGRIDNIFTDVRRQRTQIYLLTGLFAIAGCTTMVYLRAPLFLIAAFATALFTVVVFMCINFWWKISLHTALVAASVTVLIMLYGWAVTATAVVSAGSAVPS